MVVKLLKTKNLIFFCSHKRAIVRGARGGGDYFKYCSWNSCSKYCDHFVKLAYIIIKSYIKLTEHRLS